MNCQNIKHHLQGSSKSKNHCSYLKYNNISLTAWENLDFFDYSNNVPAINQNTEKDLTRQSIKSRTHIEGCKSPKSSNYGNLWSFDRSTEQKKISQFVQSNKEILKMRVSIIDRNVRKWQQCSNNKSFRIKSMEIVRNNKGIIQFKNLRKRSLYEQDYQKSLLLHSKEQKQSKQFKHRDDSTKRTKILSSRQEDSSSNWSRLMNTKTQLHCKNRFNIRINQFERSKTKQINKCLGQQC